MYVSQNAPNLVNAIGLSLLLLFLLLLRNLLGNQPLTLVIDGLLMLHHAPTSHRNKDDQCGAHHESTRCQGRVDRDRIAIKSAVREGVETILGEIRQSRETDDGSVDTTESGKAENLGGIVPISM